MTAQEVADAFMALSRKDMELCQQLIVVAAAQQLQQAIREEEEFSRTNPLAKPPV